jgi:hypothetical protein
MTCRHILPEGGYVMTVNLTRPLGGCELCRVEKLEASIVALETGIREMKARIERDQSLDQSLANDIRTILASLPRRTS